MASRILGFLCRIQRSPTRVWETTGHTSNILSLQPKTIGGIMIFYDVLSSKMQQQRSNKMLNSSNGPFSGTFPCRGFRYQNFLVPVHRCLSCFVHCFPMSWSYKETPRFSKLAHQNASIHPWHFFSIIRYFREIKGTRYVHSKPASSRAARFTAFAQKGPTFPSRRAPPPFQ